MQFAAHSRAGRHDRGGGMVIAGAAFFACLALATAARAQPEVTISGGCDTSGHSYLWTIKHDYPSPLVYIEFPHFRADLFDGPPEWKTECTNLVGSAKGSPTGTCKARVESAADGLRRGREAVFAMRVAPIGTPRGLGDVVVRFDDGTEVIVHDVEVPVRESFGDRNMPLIGLGLFFGVFLLVRALRSRRRRPSIPPDGPDRTTQ